MLNEDLKKVFSGERRLKIIEAVEVSHTETNTRLFFVKHPLNLSLTLETGELIEHNSANFVVKLPEFNENGNLDISVSFGLVQFSYIKQLETIIRNSQEKIKIKYRMYLENSYKYPQTQAPFLFSVNAIDIRDRNVSFGGALLLSIQTKLPKTVFTVENFRGLKYL